MKHGIFLNDEALWFWQVRLWYSKIEYDLRIGQLVSIWTPHVSNAEPSSLVLLNASLATSIFPEKDDSCYFAVRQDIDDGTLCKTPLGYREGEQLKGLMTLKGFVGGGYDVHDGKVLVCVKSIGGRRKCMSMVLTRLEILTLVAITLSRKFPGVNSV